ncbi:MAG TPA: S49 family peptidase [Burkholderiaceae bacterium]|nr:S49 family peptidase [Burkholderiaceae bacterium]
MRGEFLVAELLQTPWALRREVLASHVQVLARWISGGQTGRSPLAMEDEGPAGQGISVFEARRRDANARVGGNIAVIPVYGTIVQRAGMMTEWCGGSACSQISAALREAMADETVSQILMEFDSPGGSVYGVDELAAEIREARKSKTIVGFANSLSASASYYLQSQCSEVYVTPGGEAGSIGVWMAHEDYTKAMEEYGVKTTIISAGKYKVEGNPYEPLSEEARAFMQKRVDEYYQAFVSAVAKGRGCGVDAVRTQMGEGRVLGAQDCKACGMVDDVMPMQDVIAKMRRASSPTGRSPRQKAAARQREIEAL